MWGWYIQQRNQWLHTELMILHKYNRYKRYLGYPICASLTQRNTAFTNLYTSIKQSCFMHSQRQLSIRGHATVLNSLILSKLWHILRVFNLTQEQISSLQNLGSTFINHHIYPRLSNNVIQLPRHQGGLDVLNIATQQSAFQWRWLSPLLWSDPTSHSELTHCLSALRYTLNWFYATPNYPTYISLVSHISPLPWQYLDT
jgi:hypothetical protein